MHEASLFDLTGSAEDSLAKTYPWLESVLALLEAAADCGSSSRDAWLIFVRRAFLSKTSLDCFPLEPVEISESWSKRWQTWGMALHGECLTLSGSESPSAAAVCSLSDVLEPTCDVPRKYYLSATACRGILRRAARRGRELPEQLHRALEQAAKEPSGPVTAVAKTASSPTRSRRKATTRAKTEQDGERR